MSDTNTNPEGNQSPQVETISKAEYDALMSKYQKRESEAVNYQKEVERWSKLGQFDDVHGKLQSFKTLEEQSAKSPEEIKALVEARVNERLKEIQPEWDKDKEQVKTLSGRLKELQTVDQAFSLIAPKLIEGEGVPDIIKGDIRKYCDRDDEGNEIVKDDNGNIRYKKGSTSERMTYADFIEELATKKDYLIAASFKGGDKTPGKTSDANFKSITPERYGSMTDEQRDALPIELRRELATKYLASKSR